jgi:hypothetical protein
VGGFLKKRNFLIPSTIYLMLRSADKPRLEARTTSMQALVHCFQQFLHSLFLGNDW